MNATAECNPTEAMATILPIPSPTGLAATEAPQPMSVATAAVAAVAAAVVAAAVVAAVATVVVPLKQRSMPVPDSAKATVASLREPKARRCAAFVVKLARV